jgi:hypothetical protein
MKCDKCDSDATVHITEIRRGLSNERHLCERCAEMFLPLEETDYAAFLEQLPPKQFSQDTFYLAGEPEPTREEAGMTGIRQHVLIVNPDSGKVRRVGPKEGDCFSPVWSPDSKRLALCYLRQNVHSILLVEPGRNWGRELLRTTFAEPASWSPDSTRVAFSHPSDGVRVIAASDVVEGGVDRLSEIPYQDEFFPVWAPRGDLIAFLSRMVEGTVEQKSACSVLVTPLDPSKRRTLVRLPWSLVTNLGWSPDAAHLAALAMPFTSDETEELLAPPAGTLHLMSPGEPGASPVRLDGSYVDFAWVSDVAGIAGPQLLAGTREEEEESTSAVLIRPGTLAARKVADDLAFPADEIRPFLLSSDRRWLLALRAPRRDRIVRVPLDGGKVQEINPHGEPACISARAGSDEIGALIRVDAGVLFERISPDGSRRTVTVFRREDFFDVPRLVFSPDGRLAAVEAHSARTE